MQDFNNWERQADLSWRQGDYQKAADFYDRAISERPHIRLNYWHLALMQFLQGKSAEAQNVWELKMATGRPEEVESWLVELLSAWQTEANRQQAISNLDMAWLLQKKILEIATYLLKIALRVENKIIAYHLIAKLLLETGGSWQEAHRTYQDYKILLERLIDRDVYLAPDITLQMMVSLGFAPYFSDDPEHMHGFRNRFGRFYQERVQKHLSNGRDLYPYDNLSARANRNSQIIRVGYLCSCFYRHSVGWLVRWLLKYHNSERFQIYAYSLNQKNDDLKEGIAANCTFVEVSDLKPWEIAELILQNEIDILIDLDSITYHLSPAILALKPAPIQVTWLGSDASGLPAIDYFIGDRYVLPPSAPDYYAAKIWRLSNVYVAVDGFEVGVPTIRRETLAIPDAAIVYFTSQVGYKRNPDNARLQIKIIKQLENSYLIIKILGEEQSTRSFFEELAFAEGVDKSRLRFLPQVSSEEIHRANLALADVVLDTYPYNGATTTLETLWMGIPLVTRVGEQFAARNSYAMMVNVGVTEGIARTDEEYVEWGVRLGLDLDLRQKISWKLRQSRQTSPLWNAESFTRDMESAYEQMWQHYRSAVSGQQ